MLLFFFKFIHFLILNEWFLIPLFEPEFHITLAVQCYSSISQYDPKDDFFSHETEAVIGAFMQIMQINRYYINSRTCKWTVKMNWLFFQMVSKVTFFAIIAKMVRMHDNYIKVSLNTKVYMCCTKTSKINKTPRNIY